jgi:antitoxin Phd
MEWQINEAKARFSVLIDRAVRQGPQTITRGGKAVAVVVSIAEYERMKPQRKDFKEFLLAAPLDDVTIKRSRASAHAWHLSK